MRSRSPRILVVTAVLHDREVEGYEIYETVSGMVASAQRSGVLVQATDGRRLFDTELDEQGELRYVDRGPLVRAFLSRYDVAHVHMVLPVHHLLLAVLLRLRGAQVVLTPMSMLGDDFGGYSWFRESSSVFLRVKPGAVRLLGMLWRRVAVAFVVQSAEEARLAHLPRRSCSLLPLPAPRSALADAVLDVRPDEAGGSGQGPLAFVSRLDSHRKGIDRLCAWLEAYRDDLPRPAVVLYAPDDGAARPQSLTRVMQDGTLVWDTHSRGQDLVTGLSGSRGVLLLSRWDGQPRVLREAALLGLPTMSTPASHFTEVVEALGSGVLVAEPDDPAAVHRAFLALADQRRDAEAARRLFHRDSVGDFLLGLLNEVATGSTPSVDYYQQFVHGRALLPDHRRHVAEGSARRRISD